jgi:hypothetical protein
VQSADSVTKGTFRVVLSPGTGGSGASVTGTMSVEIRAHTRRLADEDARKG